MRNTQLSQAIIDLLKSATESLTVQRIATALGKETAKESADRVSLSRCLNRLCREGVLEYEYPRSNKHAGKYWRLKRPCMALAVQGPVPLMAVVCEIEHLNPTKPSKTEVPIITNDEAVKGYNEEKKCTTGGTLNPILSKPTKQEVYRKPMQYSPILAAIAERVIKELENSELVIEDGVRGSIGKDGKLNYDGLIRFGIKPKIRNEGTWKPGH